MMHKTALAIGLLPLLLAACGDSAVAPSGPDAAPGDAAVVAASPSDAAPADAPTQASDESPDVKVAGTDYNATTVLKCGFDGKPANQDCPAGVKRNWREEAGENLVEVTKPDGRKRAIFFRGTKPYGADSAQSDGSAGWDFKATRDGDAVTVRFGPETYVIIDALVEGG